VAIKGVFDFIAFMRLVRELFNDVSVDTNMDVTHAESYTHIRQTRRRKKVVNTLYEETAEKINAKQPNRAKKIGRRRRRWCIECCRLFKARDEELARGASSPPMFIDEAHYYFPQEGVWDDFNKEAAVINKLTRLGRVRKMGVVFATHSPADLNDLVIQLTNTKIAMRSEPKVLKSVNMAKYAGAYAQS
jgi:hypothetical protein